MQIIKHLRRKKGINQSGLAAAIGVSLRTIQLYEKKDANIPIKNLSKIANYFGISIGELYLKEVKEPEELYLKKSSFSNFGNICYPLENGKIMVRAPLLMANKQKDLLERLGDIDFVKEITQMDFLMDSMDEVFYMAFEVLGDSMDNGTIDAIPSGALVLCKEINKIELRSPKNFKNKTFVLICTKRIICKSITDFFGAKETIVCHNLNTSPEYTDFEVPLSEVFAVYEVVKRQL